eukprot:scaffold2850_cov175-Amphora_coffeaeformis.AAC.6
MSSIKAVQAASRALSTIAVRSHHMAPKVVLNDFAARILSGKKSAPQPAVRQPKNDIDTMFRPGEAPLDPRDFGYRVVAPIEHSPVYNSTSNSSDTQSTLGRIIDNGNTTGEYAAEEVMAAQREWDTILDAEHTRPHFELWKEDPYNALQEAIPRDLFAYVDSLEDDDFLENAA